MQKFRRARKSKSSICILRVTAHVANKIYPKKGYKSISNFHTCVYQVHQGVEWPNNIHDVIAKGPRRVNWSSELINYNIRKH